MYRVILSLLNVIEQINSPTHTTKLPKTDLLSMQTCLKLGQPELSYSAIAQWVEINYWRASNYEPRFPEFFRLPLEGRGRTTRLGVWASLPVDCRSLWKVSTANFYTCFLETWALPNLVVFDWVAVCYRVVGSFLAGLFPRRYHPYNRKICLYHCSR